MRPLRHPALWLAALPFVSLSAQAPPRLSAGANALAAGRPSVGTIDHAAIAPSGDVVAVDEKNHRLYRFRGDGTLRDSLSRLGSGPGEFRLAAGVGIGPDKEVALVDMTLKRMVWWDSSGKLIGQALLPAGFPMGISEWRDGPVIVLTDFVKEIRFARAAPSGEPRPIGILPVAPPGGEIKDCINCRSTALRDGHRLVGVTDDSTYRLIEFDAAGKVVRTWQRPPEKPRRRTPEEIALVARRLQRGPGGGAPSPEGRPPIDADKFRYPPRIVALQTDGAGRVWVRANHAIDVHPVFDLFAADGRFLGVVRTRESFGNFAIAGNRLVGWGETDDGEPALWLYRIEG